MAPERRNQIVLAVLTVVLGGAVYRAMDQGQAASPGSVVRGDLARPGAASPRPIEAPDVRLETLQGDRVKPNASERDLFRFGARPAAAQVSAANRVPVAPPPVVPVAPAAPIVPSIALKFIGVVEATEKAQTYAVLRDDRGVYHGREGEVIEGRYRILRIGAESVDVAYVDGRGRQTIRLGS
jgi:hypothetical protein